MGDMTLTELENELRTNIGGRTDYNSNLVNWLNFTQDIMSRQHDFPELEDTITSSVFTADTATYTFSTRPRSIVSVRLIDGTNSRKLSYVEPRSWDTIVPSPSTWTTGRCSHYTFFNNKLEYYRIPDSNYSGEIRYYKFPTALSGSNTSDFDSKDDIIIALASAWAFKVIGNSDLMTFWGNHGWRQLKDAVLAEGRKPDVDIKPISEIRVLTGQTWLDPFVKTVR